MNRSPSGMAMADTGPSDTAPFGFAFDSLEYSIMNAQDDLAETGDDLRCEIRDNGKTDRARALLKSKRSTAARVEILMAEMQRRYD